MDFTPWLKLCLDLLGRLKLRPRTRLPVPSSAIPAAPPPRPILLVEDDANDAFLALRVIKKDGHVCDWAQSGEHALVLAKKTAYRMMIIDIDLRLGMNGWELAKAIRRENPDMPLWLITGTSDNLFGLPTGFPCSFLLKSERPEAILDGIRMTAA